MAILTHIVICTHNDPSAVMPQNAFDRNLPSAAEESKRIDGRLMQGSNSDKQKSKVLSELHLHGTVTPSHLAAIFAMSREHVSRSILKPMIASGEIVKVENSKGVYKLATDDKTSKKSIADERISESQIFKQSRTMAAWRDNEKTKTGGAHLTRFIKIVTGAVNPNYKINPDRINRDNYESQIKIMSNAILEMTGEARLKPSSIQAIRNFLHKGLGVPTDLTLGQRLGIDNPIAKPKSAHLKLTDAQYAEIKKYFLEKHDAEMFSKLGCKIWLFIRPSALYPIKTSQFEFYDRTTRFVEIGGKRNYSTAVLDFVELLKVANPEIAKAIPIQEETTRAASIIVHEYKNQTDYKRFILDPDFVIPFEKYLKRRTVLNKKYAFWDNNDTVFTFNNYDGIVKSKVNSDLKIMVQGLEHLGFTKEDTGGNYFRGNYAMRHIGIQRWLVMTGYNYELIAEMSHSNINILKDWYGRKDTATVEKELQQV